MYFLNTKNEDHATELKSLTEAYGVEIKGIIGEGNDKIDVLAATVEEKDIEPRANEKVIEENEARVKTLKNKVKSRNESGNKLRRQLEELEIENGAKSQEIKEIEASRTSLAESHESSVNASKKSFAKKEIALGSVTLEAAQEGELLKAAHEESMAKLRKTHEKEMAELGQNNLATIAQLEDTTTKMKQRVCRCLIFLGSKRKISSTLSKNQSD